MKEKSITQEEIEQLKAARQKFNALTTAFGNIAINKHQLKQAEQMLEKEWEQFQLDQQKANEDLVNKYGRGEINLDRGVFIPAEVVPSLPAPVALDSTTTVV